MSGLKLRHRDALLPTSAALLYVTIMYVGGFLLLLHAHGWSWPLGVLAVAHAMVIASYLVHECAHNAIFADAKYNEMLGRALLWINGASYGDYAAIRHKHLRHHVDRADVIAIDYREILRRRPLLRRLIIALEAIYIPAVDSLMHALVIVLPFTHEKHRAQRKRVLINLIIRGSALLLLLIFAWPAFLGYLCAYVLFEIVLRTMDMHQHTFEVFINLEQPRDGVRFDKDYEQRNTYSNPLGRSALANLIVLNFGYHGAHHEKPALPWYKLPTLDRELTGTCATQAVSFREVLRSYRRYRITRVINIDHGDMHDAAKADRIGFVGVLGVSFLTAI